MATSVEPQRDSWKTNPLGAMADSRSASKSFSSSASVTVRPLRPQFESLTRSRNMGVLGGFLAWPAQSNWQRPTLGLEVSRPNSTLYGNQPRSDLLPSSRSAEPTPSGTPNPNSAAQHSWSITNISAVRCNNTHKGGSDRKTESY